MSKKTPIEKKILKSVREHHSTNATAPHRTTHRRRHRHRNFDAGLPEKTTLGMALAKAIQEQQRELMRHHIDRTDWIDILRHGGKIRFSSSGAEIMLPPIEERKPLKRIYLGE